MTIHCVIVANNRPQYLEQVLTSLRKYHPHLSYTIVNDDGDYGMAGNVQRAWDRFLQGTWDYVFHCEDDMVLQDHLPLKEAVAVLDSRPNLAQMLFKRQPWWHPREQELGDVLAATVEQDPDAINHGTWWEQHHIFSLNPCLIPRRVLSLGWPSDNEAGMTQLLKGFGWSFGYWGQIGDAPLVEHIGHERGRGWKL